MKFKQIDNKLTHLGQVTEETPHVSNVKSRLGIEQYICR
jgi:hypothetical protein